MRGGSEGAALAVTLVLLMAISALALAAAAAAVTALALAGYQQGAAIALEAAEAGISRAMEQARWQAGPATAGPLPHTAGGTVDARYMTRTHEVAGNGALPPGFSIGESATGFRSQHFVILSDGEATRGAHARLEQGFYVVAPGP